MYIVNAYVHTPKRGSSLLSRPKKQTEESAERILLFHVSLNSREEAIDLSRLYDVVRNSCKRKLYRGPWRIAIEMEDWRKVKRWTEVPKRIEKKTSTQINCCRRWNFYRLRNMRNIQFTHLLQLSCVYLCEKLFSSQSQYSFLTVLNWWPVVNGAVVLCVLL